MALSQKTTKFFWFFGVNVYMATSYLLVNWLNASRTHYYDVELPFESQIPFIPFFILGYSMVYLSASLLYFILSNYDYYIRTVRAFFLLTTIHLVIFILIPVKMLSRPVIPAGGGLLDQLTTLYYWVDMPQNCFPSLHVAFTFLATCAVWNYNKKWRIPYLLATLIVSVSVLLVKQHYILDIVGGLITAPVVWWIVSPGTKTTFQTE